MNVELFRIIKNIISDWGETSCNSISELECNTCDWNCEEDECDDLCMFDILKQWVVQHEM